MIDVKKNHRSHRPHSQAIHGIDILFYLPEKEKTKTRPNTEGTFSARGNGRMERPDNHA